MLKKILLLLSFSSVVIANTTMCYKQNWSNPATIENIKLDGGKCMSKKSIKDMQIDGWSIKDIKLTSSINSSNMNYLYILSKNNISNTNIKSMKENYKNLKSYEKEENIIKNLKEGKELYIQNCQSCHGNKGQIEAYNSARALNTLSLKEFELSLWEYDMGEKDNGFAILMQPAIGILTTQNIKNVYSYLESLK